MRYSCLTSCSVRISYATQIDSKRSHLQIVWIVYRRNWLVFYKENLLKFNKSHTHTTWTWTHKAQVHNFVNILAIDNGNAPTRSTANRAQITNQFWMHNIEKCGFAQIQTTIYYLFRNLVKYQFEYCIYILTGAWSSIFLLKLLICFFIRNTLW